MMLADRIIGRVAATILDDRLDNATQGQNDQPESAACVAHVRAVAAAAAKAFVSRHNRTLPCHLCLYPYNVDMPKGELELARLAAHFGSGDVDRDG